jgi:hypothetical protein
MMFGPPKRPIVTTAATTYSSVARAMPEGRSGEEFFPGRLARQKSRFHSPFVFLQRRINGAGDGKWGTAA